MFGRGEDKGNFFSEDDFFEEDELFSREENQLTELLENFNNLINRFKSIAESLESFDKVKNIFGELLTLPRKTEIKFRYDESWRPQYNFKDALKWFRDNLKDAKEATKGRSHPAAGCILKQTKPGGIYVFYHCFLSEEKEPLLSGGSPYLVVYTSEPDRSFLKMFGNKSMLLLK